MRPLRAALALLVLPLGTAAQLEYRGRETMVPMRDGVRLYTQVFEPVNAPEPCPILLTRSPYGIAPLEERPRPASLGPSPAFAEAGYVFVRQYVRGQFESEGEWQLMRPAWSRLSGEGATDEITDTQDTIDWLLENVEAHNGRVGMWGISYDAWQATMAMVDAHPALLAVSPQASPGDEYLGDDTHHNGAFRLSYVFAWIAFMTAQRSGADRDALLSTLGQEGYEFFLGFDSLAALDERFFGGEVQDWNEMMEHGDYDEYWRQRNVVALLDDVRPAVLNVVGWFDAEDFRGPLDIYQRVEAGDDEDRNWLVVGPWKHGGWNLRAGGDGSSLGDLAFGEPTAPFYAHEIELPFFEYHLRDGEDPWLPEVWAFETGANLWRELESWPPAGTEERALYLHGAGRASFEAPSDSMSATSFVSDPADPVPYTRAGPVFPGPEYMVEDQRFLLERDDVLTFTSAPLERDLVLAGPPRVELRFTTTGTDADWFVKLLDVYPADSEERGARSLRPMAGAHVLVTGEAFRAKYRESFESPSPLVPGEPTALDFALPDRLHRFRAGHRIAVQLHSTWFPMYDRNPQVFMDVYGSSVEDFEVATHRVLHDERAATRVVLPVWSE